MRGEGLETYIGSCCPCRWRMADRPTPLVNLPRSCPMRRAPCVEGHRGVAMSPSNHACTLGGVLTFFPVVNGRYLYLIMWRI